MLAGIHHALRLFGYSWRAIGPRTLMRSALRLRVDPDAYAVDSGFDGRFGTDTDRKLTPAEAGLPPDRRRHATMYFPTMDQDLAAMLAALAWPERALASSTFIDIGSGKGRVVLLAAMRRFREVIGLELSPVLHRIATANLARLTAAGALTSPARLVCGDATELEVSAGPFVGFLYHPFREPIAARVVARLNASLTAAPRPAAILYGHPTLQPALDPGVFAAGDVFRLAVDGGRATRHFRIGWSVWTNAAWLAGTATPMAARAGGGR